MLRHLTVGLLAVVAVLLGALLWLKQIDGVYSAGQTIPFDTGFAVDLTRVATPRGRCLLVRVTADQCEYCKQDQDQYVRLLAKAKEANCDAIALGPRKSALGTTSRVGTLSLTHVDFAVGRALMPFVTPQTLVVDANRRLVWQRQGALKDDDLNSASRALGRLR